MSELSFNIACGIVVLILASVLVLILRLKPAPLRMPSRHAVNQQKAIRRQEELNNDSSL